RADGGERQAGRWGTGGEEGREEAAVRWPAEKSRREGRPQRRHRNRADRRPGGRHRAVQAAGVRRARVGEIAGGASRRGVAASAPTRSTQERRSTKAIG